MTEFISQNLMLIALVLVSGGLFFWEMLKGGNGISPSQATQLMNRDGALVVDVRSPEEFASGHVPDALNIPRDQLKARVAEIEKYKGKPVVLICLSGARSSAGCGDLKAAGFTQVHSLNGGIGAWQEAGLPIRKGKK